MLMKVIVSIITKSSFHWP